MNYIDLFAGAGGLSEGFIREGFNPIAHVEMDKSACETLKTRVAYHYLKENGKSDLYKRYLLNEITKDQLYSAVPENLLNSVINTEISSQTISPIFERIDKSLQGRKIDVVIGGPPCQAYSVVGRARDPNKMSEDKRNFLFKHYAEFLRKYKPKYFVFENVLGLVTAKNYLEIMLDLFRSNEIGYDVDFKILNADDYGVLQKRKRVIIIGRLKSGIYTYPEFSKVENNWTVKKDLFSDLPKIQPGYSKDFVDYAGNSTYYLNNFLIRDNLPIITQHIARPHNDRDLQIYALVIKEWLEKSKRLKYYEIPEALKTHKNQQAFLDRFKVVDPNGASHTMVAHIAKDGHYYIYPDLEQVRSISVREAARIQSFPDDYYFEGGRTAAFRQIGNAVPPLMAQKIAKEIKKYI